MQFKMFFSYVFADTKEKKNQKFLFSSIMPKFWYQPDFQSSTCIQAVSSGLGSTGPYKKLLRQS